MKLKKTVCATASIDVLKDSAHCNSCGSDLLNIENIKYISEYEYGLRFRQELCECKTCKAKFVIRYDFFDLDGHIDPRTFSGDVNCPEYNWQDNLTNEQKKEIEEHLKNCNICIDRLSEEILSDAWFANIIHERYKK